MERKSQNQSKIMKFITTPFRILGKAKNLYVKSLTDCSTRVNHSEGAIVRSGQISGLPRSYSAVSSRSIENEDYRELIRAASVRNQGHRNEVDMIMRRQSTVVIGSKGLPKSCSVGMGRIDEEKACEFGEGEGEVEVKADLSFPRSRSCAVAAVKRDDLI